MSSAAKLGQKLKRKYSSPMVMGTVLGIKGLAERSLVEVELTNGSLTNAFYWGQADIQPGDDVVLGHIEGSDKAIYSILTANAPAVGLDPGDRDPVPDIMLWRGDTFRPKRTPKNNGDIKLLTQVKGIARLHFQTYSKMKIDLIFSIEPTNSKIEYWLYGFEPEDTHFVDDPGFMMQIGTTWRSSNNLRHRTIFDMDAPGGLGDWLDDHDEALFVLAMKRISALSTRARTTGRIRQLSISFFDDVLADSITLSATGTLSAAPETELYCHLRGSSNLEILRFWLEGHCTLDAQPIVLGTHDHL